MTHTQPSRWLRLLAPLAALSLLTACCGSDGNTEAGDTDTTESTEAADDGGDAAETADADESADAGDEAVEFLKYIVSDDIQRQISVDQPLPANRNASDVVTDPNQIAVFEGLSASTFLQQYLDQFFTPEVGGQVNEQTALLFGDATSPADAAAAITATAQG